MTKLGDLLRSLVGAGAQDVTSTNAAEDRSSTRNTFSMRIASARLRGMSEADQLRIAFRTLPQNIPLGPIVHEVVHHEGANSAVNEALQYRWLQLMRIVLTDPWFGLAFPPVVADRAVALARVEAMLQPLAEGLSLFGEFDCCIPTHDNVRSTPRGLSAFECSLLSLYGFRSPESLKIDECAAASRQDKLTATTLSRKTDVLCQPFQPSSTEDAYLLGYLWMKQLWDRCRSKSSNQVSATELVTFVAYYVYDDWVLAALLAQTDVQPEAVLNRLRSRLLNLQRLDVAEAAARFCDDKTQREQGGQVQLYRPVEELTNGPFSGLDLTIDDVRRGVAALSTFFNENVGPLAPISPGRQVADGFFNGDQLLLCSPVSPAEAAAFLSRHHLPPAAIPIRYIDLLLEVPRLKRQFCELLDIEVTCRVTRQRDCEVSLRRAAVRGRLPGPFSFEPGVYAARLSAILFACDCPAGIFCAITVGSEAVAFWRHGASFTSEEAETVFRPLLCARYVEALTSDHFHRFDTYIGTLLGAKEILSGAARGTREMAPILEEVLAAGSNRLFPNGHRGEFGFRSVLRNTQLVKALAAVGLCNSFTSRRTDIAEHLESLQLDLRELEAAAKQLDEDTGITLLHVDTGEIVSRV